MTQNTSFKRLVRARKSKTGERYTAARAMLLAAGDSSVAQTPPLATSDARIRERTGRGWEAWFDWLDARGAAEQPHREVARRIATELGIDPLAWNAQAIAVSYERARGLRVVGERADGFAISVQRTIATPAERLFDAVAGAAQRQRWLPEHDLRERTSTRPRSARFDWPSGASRVHVTIQAKAGAKSTVTVEHARLADADEADRMRAFWRERLTALAAQLTGGAPGA